MSPKSSKKRKNGRKSIQLGIILLATLAFLAASFFYVLFIKSATSFTDDEIVLYIPSSKANQSYVKPKVKSIIKPVEFTTFLALAQWTGYWHKIKPGKYVINKGTGVFNIFRKLNGGRQTPVTLTINKFRTKKDLADYIGGKLECSSKSVLRFVNNNDSLQQFDRESENAMTLIIPNTYELYWNTSPGDFFKRMHRESVHFWNSNRLEKAAALGLTAKEVYILASIVEEETNDQDEKPIMASVYLNRLKKKMPLGADPTVKFAVGDFSIKRVNLKHISSTASSPYNTYKNKGLPPGPICTPSSKTIDAVLEGMDTDFLFFCAKPDFSGSHNFAATEKEHFENARKYRHALDELKIH
jgi:UPF0755 protein